MRDSLRVAAIVFGVIAMIGGLLLGMGVAVMIFTGPRAQWLPSLTVAFSVITVGAGLGGVLALAGWASWRRWRSPALILPPLWWLAAVLMLVLGIGHLLLQTSAAWLLLPWHGLAALVPPLMVAAWLLPALQPARLSRRTLLAAFAYGGVLATLVSIVLEAGMFVLIFLLAATGTALLPGGAASLTRWEEILQIVEASGDLAALRPGMTPPLLLGVGLLLAGAVPLIEEIVKSLASLAYRTPVGARTRARVFMVGVMAGAGFSFTEALFYAAQPLPEQWLQSVLLRGLTVVIHAASTGLVALGWYDLRTRASLGALRYLVVGFAIHGLWNGLSGMLVMVGLRSGLVGAELAALRSLSAMLWLAVIIAGLAVVWIGALALLWWERGRLSRALRAG